MIKSTLSRSGAERIKAMIEDYWWRQGHAVQVTLHQRPGSHALKTPRFDLRSDMINGRPRTAQQAGAQR